MNESSKIANIVIRNIKKMSMMMPDVKSELKESVEDGLSRYPDWPELTKVK